MALWPRADPAAPTLDDAADEGGGWLQRQARARALTAAALALSLVAAVGGAVVAGAVFAMVRTREGLAEWDGSAASWGGANATDASTTILRLVTALGSTAGVLVIAAVVAVVEGRRRRARPAVLFLATVLAGEQLIVNTIKLVVARDRPDVHRLAGFASSSFPSGHAATAAAMWAAFALLLGRGRSRWERVALAALAAAMAAAVAASRVLLGVHWLTDVVAGAAIGWAWFAACSIAFGGRLLRFGAAADAAATPPG